MPVKLALLADPCLVGCCGHLSVENATAFVAEHRTAKLHSQAEAELVLKRFIYDTKCGQVHGYCNALLISLVPVGEATLAKLRLELEKDGYPVIRTREHGMLLWRRDHPPPNRTSGVTERAIEEHLRHMTILLPEATAGRRLRKCFHPEADNMHGLCRHFNSEWVPELAGIQVSTVGFHVYQRVVQNLLQQEKLDAIVPRGYDHNVCAFCESQLTAVGMCSEQIAFVKLELLKVADAMGDIAPLRMRIAELEEERHAADAKLRVHLDQRSKVEKFLHGQETAATLLPELIMLLSVDDKADLEEPKAAQSTGGGRKAFSRKLQGVQDEGKGLSYLTTTELGAGSKDANLEMYQTFLHVISHATEQRILSIVRDCASLGYAGSNIAGFIIWLADHRFFDVCCSGFHYPKHGKCHVGKLQ
mgnify:CR=1 FL=1